MTAWILLKTFGPALEVSISKSLRLLWNPRIIRGGYGLAGASVAARRRGRPVVASRATRRRMVALRDASGSSSLKTMTCHSTIRREQILPILHHDITYYTTL